MAKKNAEDVVKDENNVLAAVEARIAEMLAEAQKKADEIIAAAEAKTGKTDLDEATKAMNAAGEEYVTVKLFKDNTRYVDDVYVGVNGENCRIPRGIPVKIKKKFWDVLELSDMQDAKTAQMMDEKVNEFERESKERNM